MPKVGSKVYKARATDVIRIAELLKEALHTTDGLCYYKEGWDDAVVAKKIGGEIGITHVSRVRRELHGNIILPAKVKSPKMASIQEQIFELDTRTRAIEDFIKSLPPTLRLVG